MAEVMAALPAKVVFTGHLLKAMGESAAIALIAYMVYVVARKFAPARWANDLLGTNVMHGRYFIPLQR